MKYFSLLLALIAISGCGGLDVSVFDSLLSRQPRVVFMEPEEGSMVPPDTVLTLKFSHPIDPYSVSQDTLAVVKIEDESAPQGEIVFDVVDGKRRGIGGRYEFAEGDRCVAFRPSSQYEAGAAYMIVATPGIMGVDMIPLNQRPGSAPSPFVSNFEVAGMSGDDGGGSNDAGERDGNGAGGGSPGGAGGGEGDGAIQRVRPSWLAINEVLYDVPGSDTDGDVFVELAGEADGDITGYKIIFVNGEDGVIKDTIEIGDDAVIADDGIFLIADAKTGQSGASDVAGADLIDNFDPQNGPDCIQLVDDAGSLVDALGYGEPLADVAENGLACHEGQPAPKVASGQSLARTGGEDTDDNSADFQVLDIPTPGEF